MAVTLKLCLNQGGKSQLRRTRVNSLVDFTFVQLQALVADVFPEVPAVNTCFGYEDDEAEFVTIAGDRDLRECYEVMQPECKKALRIIINVRGEEDTKAAPTGRRGELCVWAWGLGPGRVVSGVGGRREVGVVCSLPHGATPRVSGCRQAALIRHPPRPLVGAKMHALHVG
jgi:hypothetical protein